MKTRTARAAAAAGGLAIAAAFAVSCSQATEATKDAMSSASSAVSSGASAAGSAASSAADAAGSAASSAASAAGSAASSVGSAAGSAASSAASGASSAVSSGASAASSAVSSAVDAATTMNVPGVGDVSLDTPTADAYTRLGGASALGIPTGVSEKVGDGTVTPFEKGTIFSSPAGSYVVQGEILQRYMNDQGGPAGALGWPTADETETGGGYKKAGGGWIGEFQNGTITWLNDGKGTFNETISMK
jgi:uncharacterized protein with LGFP repeats